ncbi:Class I SAM-dependent methyltransferase [Candidatus Bealeia paramacronuclearis]|uniref:Class I SAM-dependent methyltransferase n=1 Tax=Candidatus Bealeia paramacronuclearis TaxID=1921001 RepID=A0ABZ2C2R2_9PROT|nr:Class I SAM-dependent methyltransferase [Candidatus Bealeia paramacronuclearis]
MIATLSITQDLFLGGKIQVLQPVQGYRAAIDPVLLAAATCFKGKGHVLDVGAGVGVASLCLVSRKTECLVCGIELQQDLVRLAEKNITINGYEGRVNIISGDLLDPPSALKDKQFDAVMTNPPYYEADKTRASPDVQKAMAHVESVDLKKWLAFCIQSLKPKGILTLIHRAERMDEILSYLYPKMGDLSVFPLWPSAGKSARRIIIRGRKGVKSGLTFCQGLILHDAQGQFTPEAQDILRSGRPLVY